MAIVTSYLSVGGVVLAETRGGVDRDYVPDPLGSTAALLDSSQTRTDAFAYWPYGEERSRSGGTPTPFRYVGILGYRQDAPGRAYVRARHLRTDLARWQSVDPLWPTESAYGYVRNSPTTAVDPSGRQPKTTKHPWPECKCPEGHVVNVPHPNSYPFKPPQAGYPIGQSVQSRQSCYDGYCRSYCWLVESWQSKENRIREGGAYSLDVYGLHESQPECTRGNPYWYSCWKEMVGQSTGAQANVSNYPKPLPQISPNFEPFLGPVLYHAADYFEGKFCNLETLMRHCCAREASLKRARRDLVDRYRFCNTIFSER